LLRGIDVFVLSSYTVECFPMALLEAMVAGRPAVCTAVGGVPEMIEDGVTGFLVPREMPTRSPISS
jgi:glycosyltransferase involved in cell wall biosynthesis